MQQILVVEDEPTVSDVVARYLRREGYSVGIAADGEEGLRRALEERPDLIVLDLMLPRLDGLDLCRRLRASRQTPVIMLTAKGDDGDAVLGLGLGADDYVTKPFSPNELVARVKAVLRRGTGAATSHVLAFGDLRIDPEGRTVTLGDQALDLTPREFDLLSYLAAHPGQVLTREHLISTVWRYDYYGDASTVTVHIRRLREKLEPDPANPRYLKTVWGAGYKFDPR